MNSSTTQIQNMVNVITEAVYPAGGLFAASPVQDSCPIQSCMNTEYGSVWRVRS